MLQHLQFEIPIAARDLDLRAGEGIADGRIELSRIADLANGLHGGGEVGPVAAEYGRVGPDLRPARQRIKQTSRSDRYPEMASFVMMTFGAHAPRRGAADQVATSSRKLAAVGLAATSFG